MLSQLVARAALEGLRLEDLTFGLMFELIVFAQELRAEGADEETTTLIFDTTRALQALSVRQHTCARMRTQALLPVADPRLAEITNGTDHLHSGGVHTGVLDDTVSRFHHALLFTARSTHRQLWNDSTKVTVGPIFLHSSAFVAFHGEVACCFRDVDQCFIRTNVFLAEALLLSFFPRPCFLLWHSGALTDLLVFLNISDYM